MMYLKRIEMILGATFIFLVFAIIVANIVARYVFSAPLVWAEELSNFLFIWAAFLASAMLISDGRHLRIGILVDRFGPRTRAAIELVNLGIIVVVAATFLRPMLLLLGDLSMTAAMKIPEAIPYAILPITMVLFVVHAVERGMRLLAVLRGGPDLVEGMSP